MNMLSVGSLGLFLYMTKHVSGDATYCTDANECGNDVISTEEAYCFGYESCANSSISSGDLVDCFGYLSCYDSVISGASETMCDGLNGCYGTAIQTASINNYGYEACKFCSVKPEGTELNVYNYGYFSGEYMDVYCYNGDTCTIDCGSAGGCYELYFYCYSGATCSYKCDEDPDQYCPTIYTGISSDSTATTITSNGIVSSESIFTGLTDKQIDNFAKQRQIKKKAKLLSSIKNMDIIHYKKSKRALNNNDFKTKWKLIYSGYTKIIINVLIGVAALLMVGFLFYKKCQSKAGEYTPIKNNEI